jgi:protoheme IX farnesyltransferase
MPRTQNRPLTAHRIPLGKAFAFSIATAVSGVGILGAGTSFTTCLLGASNLVLYSFVYTPLKRISRWNTWIGAVVGAIPPLMGWTAACEAVNLSSLLLPALLYSWQFPHFFALSWNLRKEYSRAGYEMLPVLHPEKSTLVAFRYSLLIPVISGMFYGFGVGGEKFLACALALDAALVWNAIRFRINSNSENAKRLFFASLVHLPIYLAALSVSNAS